MEEPTRSIGPRIPLAAATLAAATLVTLATALAPRCALAVPTYYDNNCSACHGTTAAGGVQTCAGCHAHGTHPSSAKSSLNLTGTTSKTSYAPGETVSVTINAGYRSGWVRALLYDQNLHEVARSTGTVKPGFFAPCCGSGFPITLTAPAPTTPGTYTWWVAWYGNQYDASGAFFGANWTPSTNPGHGEERVQTNAFTVTTPTAPRLALAPPSLSFGSVNVGTSSALPAVISNTGTAPLTVSAIALCSGTQPEFSWAPAAPITVPAGGNATLTVTFAATNADTDVGCLALSSNDPANPTTNLAVSATGVVPPAPAIALAPPSLSFGTVTVGGSAMLTAQVQDAGTADLHVATITRCSGTSTAFTWSPAAPFTVAAGGSTSLSVTYAPTAAAGDSGCLVLASDDPVNPGVQLAVAGNGAAPAAPVIAFVPPTLAYGTVTIGTSSTQTAQIRNTGTAPLHLAGIALCSGTAAEFTWSTPLPLTVAAGQSVPLPVTFTPADVDVEQGCLAVSSDDPARPVANLALSAQGAAAPTPAVAVSPPGLDFSTVQVGASATLPVTIQDAGGAPLTVSSIAPCSGTSPEFSWAPAAPFTVPPSGSATLSVVYAPADDGPDNGCLSIGTDDPVTPTVTVGLSGAGSVVATFPAIALVPGNVDFGTVTDGASASATVQVRNTGSAPLHVLGISRCAGTSPEFGWSPDAPFTVMPGAATALAVGYAPTDVGADSGCLAVASDDPTTPGASLQLSGTGAAPGQGLDVDIVALQVPRLLRFTQPTATVTPRLVVRNASPFTGTAQATLVATRSGTEIYRQQVEVSGVAPGATATVTFPPLAVQRPARRTRSTIAWTAQVTDDDPDTDVARASTTVTSGGGGEDFRAALGER